MTYGNQPFGLNQVKIKSSDNVVVTLDAARVLNFVPRLRTSELNGAKKIMAASSIVVALDWFLEEGGLPLAALAIMTGWTATDHGSTPNRTNTLTARAETDLPYFAIYGRILGQAGDDVHIKIFKAKIMSDIDGAFEYGEFKVTRMSGVAIDDGAGLFELVQNETATELIRLDDRLLLEGIPESFLLMETGDYLLRG